MRKGDEDNGRDRRRTWNNEETRKSFALENEDEETGRTQTQEEIRREERRIQMKD